jgi:hypothetical protein
LSSWDFSLWWIDVSSIRASGSEAQRIAQAETWEDLRRNLLLAIGDWLAETQVKTEDEAKQLAAIQGSIVPVDRSFAETYDYLPTPSWTDEDE